MNVVMDETTQQFVASDGITLHTYRWFPAEGQPIRAVILLLHGLAEHAGRYRHVAEHLTAHGYAVYALDHRGHGRSGGARVYLLNFDDPVNDAGRLLHMAAEAHPGLPLFVFAHSMGTVIGLKLILRQQERLRGAITSGTPLALDTSMPAPLVAVLRGAAALLPRLRLLPIAPATLTHDPAMLAAHRSDTLVDHGRMRLGTVVRMVDAAAALREVLHQLHLPLLILHGAADELIPPAGSQHLMEKAASSDKTLRLYPGMGHEIVNEIDRTTVLSDITAWLNAHI